MRVLLAGATGTIGTELTAQLLAAGHEVVGLTRRESGARRLTEAGADGVVADILDAGALREALAGRQVDAVVHEGTAIAGTPIRHRDLYPTNALRTYGTANLLRVARDLGAHRFVTQSFLYVYGYVDHGEVPVTEDAPLGPGGGGAFDRHVAAMRSNERQVLEADDIDGIALRYGFFYGAEPATRGMLDSVARRRLPAPRRGTGLSLVHVEDAAAATVAALERGRGGEAYNVAADERLTWTAYFDAVAEAAGAKRPLRLPNVVFRASPYLGVLMTRASIHLDSTKAEQQLGWRPSYPSVREGLAAVVRGGQR
ncbi:NAD-dependent epimerase/dehydratase family protein [Georgenia subflava]|uniref:NAD-dependent epimerase/dehydratase family protein n=1 Tax=Georgenia subflava TaxID=1622177 RepID=A0A6N7EFG7_9MICO|nr:NAD-dependent epimerase/dehydratase family protein [Georgenia subflava]MPV37152.1 NAD-dependent epimerase/dehydratase family protein [Georgenia subflava]